MKHTAAALAILLLALTHQAGCETARAIRVIHKVYPIYPFAARDKRLEGAGLFQLRLRPNGTVGSVSVVKSTGHALLDDAALTALRQWRFTPPGAAHDVKVPLNFTMKGVFLPPAH